MGLKWPGSGTTVTRRVDRNSSISVTMEGTADGDWTFRIEGT